MQLQRISLRLCTCVVHLDCLTFSRIPISLLHKVHHPLHSTGCVQCKFFPLSRFCCGLPSRHAASAPQARQLRQDLYSSHSLGCTKRRERKDLLRFVTRAGNQEKVTIGRRALANKSVEGLLFLTTNKVILLISHLVLFQYERILGIPQNVRHTWKKCQMICLILNTYVGSKKTLFSLWRCLWKSNT